MLIYSDRLSEYAGNGYRPKATGSRLAPDGVIVTSEIVRDSGSFRAPVQPIRIDWRLTVRDGVYKISDVIIAGLSMATNGRSQLEGVVERNGGRAQAIWRSCANKSPPPSRAMRALPPRPGSRRMPL